MSELATIERPESALRTITPEQKELVRNMVFKGANDDELSLYFFECQRRGVHPLDRLIHPQKRKAGGISPVSGGLLQYSRSLSCQWDDARRVQKQSNCRRRVGCLR